MPCTNEFPSDEPEIPESDPVRKYILTELIIGRVESTGVSIRYKFDGRCYTLSPFPAKIRPDVVRQLQTMARIPGKMREGTLDETAGNLRLKWTVRMTTPEDELILTPQPSTP